MELRTSLLAVLAAVLGCPSRAQRQSGRLHGCSSESRRAVQPVRQRGTTQLVEEPRQRPEPVRESPRTPGVTGESHFGPGRRCSASVHQPRHLRSGIRAFPRHDDPGGRRPVDTLVLRSAQSARLHDIHGGFRPFIPTRVCIQHAQRGRRLGTRQPGEVSCGGATRRSLAFHSWLLRDGSSPL